MSLIEFISIEGLQATSWRRWKCALTSLSNKKLFYAIWIHIWHCASLKIPADRCILHSAHKESVQDAFLTFRKHLFGSSGKVERHSSCFKSEFCIVMTTTSNIHAWITLKLFEMSSINLLDLQETPLWLE